MTYSLPLFYYRHATPPDLPSFPTRRSSDLNGRPETWPAGARLKLGIGFEQVVVAADALIYSLIVVIPILAGERSEEHTSELQSPCNLVCRLLLEKKKEQIRRSASRSY